MIRTKTIFTLITFILLLACSSTLKNNKINNDSTTTEIESITNIQTYPNIFETAFYNGTKAQQGKMRYTFSNLDLGKIKIISSKIIACDPIAMHNGAAFTQNFPNGNFPVQLAIAKTNKDERVAFSRILFSEKPVSKWEFALKPGQKPIGLKDTSFYCYGVDAGTGIFIDETSNKQFNSFKGSTWEEVFVNKMEKYNYKGFIHNFGEHNIAIFSTGYGDGCYATYIGYDNEGKVCRLITDFGLIAWWKGVE